MVTTGKIVFSLCFGCFSLCCYWIFDLLIRKPRRLMRKLEKQGITGPKPCVFIGNIHEMKRISQEVEENKCATQNGVSHSWTPVVFPYLERWRKIYGSRFVYSVGNIPILSCTDPEIIREMCLCTSLDLGVPLFLSTDRGPLLGRGIFSSNGAYWAYQRKIIAPEFYLNKVKGTMKLMVESTMSMLKTWEEKSVDGKLEINVDEDLQSFSADIISRVCFGRSYIQGEQIFKSIRSLERLVSRCSIGVPGLRSIPTKRNLEIWKLAKEIDLMILEIIKSRSGDNTKRDLLQMILTAAESCEDENKLPATVSRNQFIIDNCKNIYLAGHETTAISASWCFMTLAAYPDWQARVREEVLQICSAEIPTADMIPRMKLLTMVIQETLRLYPPVPLVLREALADLNMGGITILKGTIIEVPIPIMHRDETLWGPDAHLFKPERFAKGISGACKAPYAFMPFGFGTRTCVGQNFAMAELKILLSLTLSKYAFSLAPTYQHSPGLTLLMRPQFGVSLMLEKLYGH